MRMQHKEGKLENVALTTATSYREITRPMAKKLNYIVSFKQRGTKPRITKIVNHQQPTQQNGHSVSYKYKYEKSQRLQQIKIYYNMRNV